MTGTTEGVVLAKLQQEMSGLREDVQDIKRALAAIATLDKTIAELVIHTNHTQVNIQKQWEVIDTFRARINDCDNAVTELKSTWKGGTLVGGALIGVIQIAVVGFVAYVFDSSADGARVDAVHEHRIQRAEEQLTHLDKLLTRRYGSAYSDSNTQ